MTTIIKRRDIAATLAAVIGGAALAGCQDSSPTPLDPGPGMPPPSPWIDLKSFGALGDGTTDDSAAATRAASAQNLLLTPGTYLVKASITFTGLVSMQRGAVLKIESGATITFAGGFSAAVHQVFSGAGQVVFARAFIREGYPEWWGAVTGGPDCLAALQAALQALPIVQLQAADYFTSATLRISTPHVTLRGVSKRWAGANQATRVIVKSGTADVVFIGTETNPGGVNRFLSQVEIRNLEVTRDRAVTPPSNGAEITGAAGIRLQFTIFTYIEQVHSSEHTLGFVLNGTVRTHLRDCIAFRSQPGVSSVNDVFYGYLLNGNAQIGLAGGNASTYITDCTAGTGGIAQSPLFGSPALADSVGFGLSGPPVDTFFIRPEASAVNSGIFVSGDGSQAGNADLHIINPIIDQFGLHGLFLSGVGPYGAVDVVGGYFAPAGGNTSFCIRVRNCVGMTALTNNQYVAWSNPLAIGLFVESSSGVAARSNMHLGSRRPVGLTGSTSCEIADVIHNPEQMASQAAVRLESSSRNRISPIVKGKAGAFPQGILLAGIDNAYNELSCTGIDASSIAGGAANKLVIGATGVTATGLTGTNLVSGVMQ